MQHSFLIKLQPYFDKAVDTSSIFTLSENVSISLTTQGPCRTINNDDYFYFRFGTPLGANLDVIDLNVAQELKKGDNETLKKNNGYFSVFFFNKNTGKGYIYADRIGVHKIYFQCSKDALMISNQADTFDFNIGEKVDREWLTEIVNFKICTGSHTYKPHIKQLPAGHHYRFDSDLSPISAGFYWEPEDRVSHTDLSLDDATKNSLAILNRHLSDANIKAKRVAVLLSGGVDSSLLAALTKEHNENAVAITPVFSSGQNPELEAANAMAKSISIEHQAVEITDSDIRNEFSRIVNFLKQPIRSPQTIIFSILMRKLQGRFDAVIFGEGADMIFGYHAVLQAGTRYEKYRKVAFLKPMTPLMAPFKSIGIIRKFTDLICESVANQVLNSWAIEYSPDLKEQLPKIDLDSNKIEIVRWLQLPERNHKNLGQSEFENLIRRFIIQESCYYHFYSMGAIANRDGIELISPFFDSDIVKYAANFENKLYFGDEFTKPILRKINERFYKKDLIYVKKKGFPVPHKNWLNGPLLQPANQAKDFIRNNFSDDAAHEDELVWLVMALQELGIADTLSSTHIECRF